MSSVLIATEDPHLVFHRLFNSSFQTLGFIKARISQMFISMYRMTSQDNPFAFQDLIASIGNKYQHKTQDLPPPYINSKGGGVFNVLDAILKSSLDRLKLMKSDYKLKASYTQHIHTIRNLSLQGMLVAALCLRNNMIQKGLLPDVVTHNYLINGLCKVGAFEKAEWLKTQMDLWGPSPNVATYNTLMKGYCAFGDIDKALDIMSYGKVKPNRVTDNILAHALFKKGNVEEAMELLKDSEMTLIASTILMDSSFKRGDTSLAFTLWKEMINKEVDVVAYNVVIHGYCLRCDLITAYNYVNQMLKIGFLPDKFTYNTLINTLFKMKQIDEAFYLYKVMLKMGIVPDKVSYDILIQGLCRVGNVVTAHELLNSMLENSMVPPPLTWNIIIGGYGRQGDRQKALHVRDQMMEYGVLPNVYTHNALIQMLIEREEISEVRSVMKKMILAGPLPDTVTYNLLVREEKEFGDVFSAKQVYDKMLKRGCEPDVITYTQLIKGFCLRGRIQEAERIFLKMVQSRNLVIDHVPFQILMKKYFKIRNLDGVYCVYQTWLRIDQGE